MLSIRQKIERVEALLGTDDLTEYEAGFVQGLVNKVNRGLSPQLSDRQIEILDQIFDKHFAA